MNEFIVIITSVLIGVQFGYHIRGVRIERRIEKILKERQTIEINNMSYDQLREELRLSRERTIELTEKVKEIDMSAGAWFVNGIYK